MLTTAGHDDQAYPLTGPEALAPGEQVEILAEVLGRELRYVDVPPAAARGAMTDSGMPDDVADAVIALLATGLDASSAVVHPDRERTRGNIPGMIAVAHALLRNQPFAAEDQPHHTPGPAA